MWDILCDFDDVHLLKGKGSLKTIFVPVSQKKFSTIFRVMATDTSQLTASGCNNVDAGQEKIRYFGAATWLRE